jgi:hypothetical protein
MGIQINGNTDTITAIDGALTVSGAELSAVTNLNATGIVTASGFVGNITGNINATGVSTIATLNVTQSNPTNLNVSGVTTTATLRATSIVGVTTAGITTAYIGSVNDGPISGARNRIINGDMRIDQRNAGVSTVVSTAGSGGYTLDRWNCVELTDGVATVIRSGTAPVGFTSSLLWTTTTADASLAATQYCGISHFIEGFNISDLSWGTANAVPVTLSFWVRSSLTGTFGGAIRNPAGTRSYPFTYTISSANTFEYKTITIPGDTSGTYLTDNSAGIQIYFSLGTGSNFTGTAGSWAAANYIAATSENAPVIGTLNATWYLTGVQLEPGTVATPFERRSYGQELALCQRYYCKSSDPNVVATNGAAHTTTGMFYSGVANVYSTTNAYGQTLHFPVTMRATPSTVTFINTSLPTSPASGSWSLYTNNTWVNAACGVQNATSIGFGLNLSGSGWSVTGSGSGLFIGAWTASAEL